MLALGIATFFAFGIVLVLLGATQAELARDLGLDLAGSGLLGATLAVGIGVGVVAAGPLSDRWPRKPLYAAACALSAGSLFAIGPGLGVLGMAALLFSLGLGGGAYITVINAAAVDRFRERTASALALVHSAATFGACVGPMFVQLVREVAHWTDAFRGVGVLHASVAFAGLFTRFHDTVPRERDRAGGALVSPALIALGAAAFAYVGTENGITLFAVPWALERLDTERAGQWSISTFWFGLLIGRLLLALRATARSLQLLAAAGLGGGLVLCVTSALALGPLPAATALAGLAMGPVYPLLVTLSAQRFPAAPGAAVGLVTGMGAVGGSVVPWFIGGLGDALGLRTAIALLGSHAWIITAGALVLLRADGLRERSREA